MLTLPICSQKAIPTFDMVISADAIDAQPAELVNAVGIYCDLLQRQCGLAIQVSDPVIGHYPRAGLDIIHSNRAVPSTDP